MSKPHHRFAYRFVLLCLSFLLSGLTAHLCAQQVLNGTARGIELYQQGDSEGAIRQLEAVIKKNPDDADAWYYLGLANNREGWIGNARQKFARFIELRPDSADAHAKVAYAFIIANDPQKAVALAQRAIELGDQSAESHYAIAEANLRTREETLNPGKLGLAVEEAETALRINPDFAPALITKSFALFHLNRYSEAANSLENLLAIRPNYFDSKTWREQLEYLRKRAGESTAPATVDSTIFTGATVSQRARILSKPEPVYTEAARRAGVVGTVVLRALLASNGEVKNIYVVDYLNYGLTTRSIEAARKIRFTPALKDEQPVSMYIQLEYNFNLY